MPQTCDDIRIHQLTLMAGKLSARDEAEFVEHLNDCADCRIAMDALTTDGEWDEAACVLRAAGQVDPLFFNDTNQRTSLPAANVDMFISWLSPTDDPESLGRISNMEIRGVIGHGGAGVVYKGFDSALGRNVAIKLMNPSTANQESARTRFAREARAMAAITHENVVPVYAVAEHNDLPYLVMEYVPGGTLARRLENTGPLDVIETTRVGLQVAQGLAAAHRQGVVHRDVKPSNILLDPGVERVRVTDFGLARALNEQTHTESGVLVGTPQYMSPEQVCSETVDGRSDLFSLGSVLYNCCTGKQPFEAESIYATMQKVAHDAAPSARQVNSAVPEWLDELISRLHSRSPDDRINSAEELASILEAELLFLQQPESAPQPERTWSRRDSKRSFVAGRRVALAALVLAMAAATSLLMPTENNTPEPVAQQQRQSEVIPAAPQPPDHLPPQLQEWVDRLVAANEHKAIAFGISPNLMKLPPEDAVLVAQAAWPNVTDYSARRGILKAFQFATHPQVVAIMHLGMTDQHEEVRETAEFYLRTIALRSFKGDTAGYKKWYAEFGDKPLSEIFAAGYARLARTLDGVEAEVGMKILKDLNDDFGGSNRKSSYKEKRDALRRAGLAELVLEWCNDESLDLNQISELSYLIETLPLTKGQVDSFARPLLKSDRHLMLKAAAAKLVTETDPDAGRKLLLKMVADLVRGGRNEDPVADLTLSRLAQTLAEFGEPQAIPALIAIMDSDNSPEVRSAINRAMTRGNLGKITGVKNSQHLDGPWWRRWWDDNQERMPVEVREMKIGVLPKTEFGKTYKSTSAKIETHDGRQKMFLDAYTKFAASGKTDGLSLSDVATAIAEHGDPRDIPFLIGAIEADNSYETIYGVGYFGLGEITDVGYSSYHDSAWWRRWWEANKAKFPKDVQKLPIAKFPKTKHGQSFRPFPDDLDTHEGRARFLTEQLQQPEPDLYYLARLFSDSADPRSIPVLIGVIAADQSGKANYDIGYYGLGFGELGKLTKVQYDKSHNAVWWKAWWATHRENFPTAANIAIPEFKMAATAKTPADPLSDVAEIPAEDRLIDGDKQKRYFLIGDTKSVPKDGYKLAIVLPGGDGGVDFHPFVRRVYKNTLDESWLVAQPVAVQWNDQQKIVWPTKIDALADAKFTTEDFVDMVIADVQKQHAIAAEHIVTLGWSSSGPAAYAIAMREDSSITGSYIAMSVFKPSFYESIEAANGRRFVIDHSPDDDLCPYAMSVTAEGTLTTAGANVKRLTYSGGHGWRGDVYGRIKEGLTWLVEASDPP